MVVWEKDVINQLKVPDTVLTSNISGIESDIISMPVPRGVVWDLRQGVRTKVFLYTKDTFSGDGSTVTFSLTKDLVDSPNLPAVVGDTIVFVSAALQTSGYTVDYVNNQITFGSAPATGVDNVVVYYLFVPALVKVKVAGASKEVSRERPIHTGNITDWHLNNQYATQTAVYLGNSWVLDEKQYLKVAVKAAAVVSWDAAIQPYQLFELDILRAPRSALDQKDIAVIKQFAVTL